MAGLWERWGRGADRRETAAVVTTRANGAVASIHDRMPVVLRAEDEDAWLDADDPEVLRGLPDPVSPDALRAYPVSTAVNDPANDDPTVTEPADVGKQSGLSEFS